MEAGDIHDEATGAALGDILLFGDDFQGWCVGFEKSKDLRVGEVSPTDGTAEPLASSFEEYFRTFLVPEG